jgi:alpha-glucosidase (family GH31 glycosyl hydrolase)
MSQQWNRREVLKGLVAASTAIMISPAEAAQGDKTLGEQVEIRVTPLSANTFRMSILPLNKGLVASIPFDGSLLQESWGSPAAQLRAETSDTIAVGNFRLKISCRPASIRVANEHGDVIQQFDWDQSAGVLAFLIGNSPLFGLGEGGPQFDRRGSADTMRSGQGGYKLAAHGGRVPIPWIVSTSGWAMFLHQPYGTFDFTGSQGKFQSANPGAGLDLFFVASSNPATIMAEYTGITGHPEMPPLWSFGYQQSHRTLASREEVLAEAKTFREKKLPCDALIYLGTGFCPSGWNTENGSFVWNSRVFPDPKEMLGELHREDFKAVVHVVILSDKLRGTVHDPCELSRFDEEAASCHWDAHRKDFALGIDG